MIDLVASSVMLIIKGSCIISVYSSQKSLKIMIRWLQNVQWRYCLYRSSFDFLPVIIIIAVLVEFICWWKCDFVFLCKQIKDEVRTNHGHRSTPSIWWYNIPYTVQSCILPNPQNTSFFFLDCES